MTVYDLKNSFQYAMHGLGAYKGLRQTNSYEALHYWYNKGIKVFEVDIARTDDNQYVALAHDFSDFSLRRLELLNSPKQKTYKWFMKQKLFSISTKGLTPLSLVDVVEFVNDHPDVIVMLDLFGMFKTEETSHFTETLQSIVCERFFLWEKLLLEAYNFDMVDGISCINKTAKVIYCARYEKNINNKTTVKPEILLSRGVEFVSYPWYCHKKHPTEIRQYSEAGIVVFSRTKFNTKDMILKKNGVNVNIISKRFDGVCALFQVPIYLSSYLKRIIIKLYIKYIIKFKLED